MAANFKAQVDFEFNRGQLQSYVQYVTSQIERLRAEAQRTGKSVEQIALPQGAAGSNSLSTLKSQVLNDPRFQSADAAVKKRWLSLWDEANASMSRLVRSLAKEAIGNGGNFNVNRLQEGAFQAFAGLERAFYTDILGETKDQATKRQRSRLVNQNQPRVVNGGPTDQDAEREAEAFKGLIEARQRQLDAARRAGLLAEAMNGDGARAKAAQEEIAKALGAESQDLVRILREYREKMQKLVIGAAQLEADDRLMRARGLIGSTTTSRPTSAARLSQNYGISAQSAGLIATRAEASRIEGTTRALETIETESRKTSKDIRALGEATAITERNRKLEALEAERAKSADAKYASVVADLAVAVERRKVTEGLATQAALRGSTVNVGGETRSLVEAEGQLAALQRTRAAQIEAVTQQALRQDEDYIQATGLAARARREIAIRTEAAAKGILDVPGEDLSRTKGRTRAVDDIERQKEELARRGLAAVEGETGAAGAARIALFDRAETARRSVLVQQAIAQQEGLQLQYMTATQLESKSILELEAQEKTVRAALNNKLRGQLVASGAQPASKNPSVLSRFDTSTLGGFFAQRFVATAGYAVGAGALFGIVSGIREAITAATELEKTLSIVKTQMENTGQGQLFGEAREQILKISRDTGEAGDTVAFIFQNLQAAFGGDTTRALQETNDAIKITKVTGLDVKEVIDSLTGASVSFGTSFKEIGNQTLAAQQAFGVQGNHIIEFISDIGPAAKDAGFSLRELVGIAGALQEASSRTGGGLSENLGRIIPGLVTNAQAIGEQFLQNPNTIEDANKIFDAQDRGNAHDILQTLIDDWEKLTPAQQKAIATAAAGERQYATFLALFSQEKIGKGGSILDQLRRFLGSDQDTTGLLDQYFGNLQTTLAQKLARLKEAFKQLGVGLFEGGLGSAFKDFAVVLTGVAEAVGTALSALGKVDEFTGGMIGDLAAAAIAVGALATVWVLAARGVDSYRRSAALAAGQDLTTSAVRPGIFGAGARAAGSGVGTLLGSPLAVPLAVGIGAFEFAKFWKARVDHAREAAIAERDAMHALSTEALRGVIDKDPSVGDRIRGALGISSTTHAANARGELTARRHTRAVAVASAYAHADDEQLKQIFGKGLTDQDIADIANATSIGEQTTNNAFGGVGLLSSHKISSKDFYNLTHKYVKDGKFKPSGDLSKDVVKILDSDAIKELSKQAINGTGETQKAAIALFEYLDKLGVNNKIIQDTLSAIKGGGKAKPVDPARHLKDVTQLSLQELEDQFSAGQIGLGTYQKSVEAQLTRLSRVTQGGTKGGKALRLLYFQTLQKAEQIQDDAISGIYDNLIAVGEASGHLDPAGKAQILLTKVQAPGLSLQGKFAAATEAIAALREAFQKSLEGIEDPIEKLRRENEGFQIPEVLRTAVVAGQLDPTINPISDLIFSKLAEVFHESRQGMRFEILAAAEAYVKTGQTIEDFSIEQIDELKNSLIAMFAYVSLFPKAKKQAQEVLQRIKDLQAAEDFIKGQPDLAIQDPGSTGTVEDKSGDEKAAADQAIQDQRARIELAKSLVERDPIRAAEIDKALAEFDKAHAKTEADRLRAEAAINQANARIRQGFFDIINSQVELAIAMAQAGGNNLKAAEQQAKLARIKLFEVVGDPGSGEAERNRAMIEVINADAAVRNQVFQDRLDTINFQLEMDKITASQAIHMLQELLKTAKTTEQRRTILRQIKQLEDALSQDLQFNIPSEIKLPTLYEVRRLNQTGRDNPGGAYQDNRQVDNRTVNITLNASNAKDAEKATDRIIKELNAPSRNGVYAKRYGG